MLLTDVGVPDVEVVILLTQVDQGDSGGVATGEDGQELCDRKSKGESSVLHERVDQQVISGNLRRERHHRTTRFGRAGK